MRNKRGHFNPLSLEPLILCRFVIHSGPFGKNILLGRGQMTRDENTFLNRSNNGAL